MKIRILLLVGLLLAGCSPKITTNLAETRAPLPEDALIVVLGLDDVVPAGAEYLGKIKVGDSGLTKTGEGTLEKVLALAKEQVKQIAAILLKGLGMRLSRQVGIELSWNEAALSALADQGFDPNFGARPLRRLLTHTVETALSKSIIKGEVKEGDTVGIGCENGEFTFSKE